jgi:molecular chaperone DnaJ
VFDEFERMFGKENRKSKQQTKT